jgi:hypothetical protein
MQRRDLIKDQIEQLGRVLSKMVDTFLKLKTNGQANDGLTLTEQSFNEEFDLDLNAFLTLSEDEIKAFLIEKNFTDDHLCKLTSLLIEIAEAKITQKEHPKALQYLSQAEYLLSIHLEYDDSFSMMETIPSLAISFENTGAILNNRIKELQAKCDL